MFKAIYNGATIAESETTVVVEGNHYFPPDSVKMEHLVKSDAQTHCPWKGDANYFHVEVDGKRRDEAAWVYHEPKDAAKEIKDHIAFWRGVEVVEG